MSVLTAKGANEKLQAGRLTAPTPHRWRWRSASGWVQKTRRPDDELSSGDVMS